MAKSLTANISGANLALGIATLAFAANFSVWILYAVVGLNLQTELALNATELGFLFAAPMLTGALGRIPAGLLAERYSPRSLYIGQMLLVAPSLFLLPYVNSYSDYVILGLWMGISGTSFTFGISYVTQWFERHQQGTAMGIFGAGNAGAAISLVIAPLVANYLGWNNLGFVYGAGLLLMAGLFAVFAPKLTHAATVSHDFINSDVIRAPTANKSTAFKSDEVGSLSAIVRNLQVWRFGLYYYFVFGSFLALILWLPQYYVNAYKLSFSQAMAFTLFFVATSSMVRALGGWFADKYGGRSVNWNVFWISIVCLFFLSYPPTTMTIHGVDSDVHLNIEVNVWVFSSLIFVIGIAQGFGRASVYKIIHDYYPQHMGAIGGFVAALGALGGCTLPIFFGLAEDLMGIYSSCFMILYGVLAMCMVVMFLAQKSDRHRQRVMHAENYNFLDFD